MILDEKVHLQYKNVLNAVKLELQGWCRPLFLVSDVLIYLQVQRRMLTASTRREIEFVYNCKLLIRNSTSHYTAPSSHRTVLTSSSLFKSATPHTVRIANTLEKGVGKTIW